jgi:hypothetical protein
MINAASIINPEITFLDLAIFLGYKGSHFLQNRWEFIFTIQRWDNIS